MPDGASRSAGAAWLSVGQRIYAGVREASPILAMDSFWQPAVHHDLRHPADRASAIPPHRRGGEDTEHFHKVASRFLLGALVFLAPGMAGDLLIVLRKSAGHSFWLVSRRDCCWPRFMGCGLG